MRTVRLALALLAVALLAGCAAPLSDPTPTPATGTPRTAVGGGDAPPGGGGGASMDDRPRVPCPDAGEPAPEGAVAAPRWREGDWWRYAMLDEAGVARGRVTYEVLGCWTPANRTAYLVRETRLEWGHPPGLAEQPRVLPVGFEVATLSRAWDDCGPDWHGFGPCSGVLPEWSFPLTEGKTWAYACCGDVVTTYDGRASRNADGSWNVTTFDKHGEGARIATWTYAPELGLFTRMEGHRGDGPGSWELRAHGQGGLPAETVVPSSPTFARETACVPDPSRGPSGSAPLLGAWNASPEGLMVRLSRAVGDPLVGEPARDPVHDVVTWSATNGTMEAWLGGAHERPPSVTWRSSQDLSAMDQEDAMRWLRGTLERFAFADAARVDAYPEHATRGWRLSYGQSVAGRAVVGIGGSVENGYGTVLTLGPAHRLPDASELRVSEADALASAKSYMRCALDRAGMTEAKGHAFVRSEPDPPFAIRNDSLAYQFLLEHAEVGARSHCGLLRHVYVDAVNGAILGHETPPCA